MTKIDNDLVRLAEALQDTAVTAGNVITSKKRELSI